MVARTIIAQYVKEMRKKYKLTQVDLSEKAGVGLRFARELEQGKTTLRLDKVNKVFELFGSECGPVPMKREGDDVWNKRFTIVCLWNGLFLHFKHCFLPQEMQDGYVALIFNRMNK